GDDGLGEAHRGPDEPMASATRGKRVSPSRHGRTCSGHPRLLEANLRTWMPAIRERSDAVLRTAVRGGHDDFNSTSPGQRYWPARNSFPSASIRGASAPKTVPDQGAACRPATVARQSWSAGAIPGFPGIDPAVLRRRTNHGADPRSGRLPRPT